MEKEEILEKASSKKAIVGEMEKAKINKSNWISVITVGIMAVCFMIIEGLLGHISAIYAIATICFSWASVFYFCQFFIAKRPVGVLIGGILEAVGAITMITLYIIRCV
ncbi:MAG: hypothetical protein IJT25_02190 [Clostridia bacterium]|nr:hypothetical protein [Clostridia bacterium]